MADRSYVELTIHEQRLLLIQHHRQQWRDLSDLVVTSCQELHEQHRQQWRQLMNPTLQQCQALIKQQVDHLLERHQANQALRDELRVKQKHEWTVLDTPSNKH